MPDDASEGFGKGRRQEHTREFQAFSDEATLSSASTIKMGACTMCGVACVSKPGRLRDWCTFHDKKKKQFHEQAARAGKKEELEKIERDDPVKYDSLFKAFCDTLPKGPGRPAQDSKFDWGQVKRTETAGQRHDLQRESVPLCKEEFIRWYSEEAPTWQRSMATLIVVPYFPMPLTDFAFACVCEYV